MYIPGNDEIVKPVKSMLLWGTEYDKYHHEFAL